MSALAGERPRVGKYELLEEVGHGGMATVYRAYDERLDREVAIKVIHRHLRENREVAARFSSEARAVAKLEHPNIVKVYDVSSEEEVERWLVVELVRGTTLRRLLQERAPLPPEVAAAVGTVLAGALQHAHDAGVVHRDVKPENVLVELSSGGARRVASTPRASAAPLRADPTPRPTEQRGACAGRLLLTDFGIAKLLDAQGVTSTGQVLGSPAHMAPEQIEGGDVGPTADVFGLGVLLYECLTGKLPFDGKNPAQVLRRVLDGEFTPPARLEPRVGEPLSAIVCKALAHQPEARFASCRELAAALQAELTGLGFGPASEELSAFIADEASYRSRHEAQVVEHLLALGTQAQARGDALGAAGAWNRALAYRPDDAELLARVSGLARQQRTGERLRRAGVLLGVAAVVGGLSFLAMRWWRPVSPTIGLEPSEARLERSVDFKPPQVTREELLLAPSPSMGAALDRKPTLTRLPPPPAPSARPSTRRVRVVFSGVQGARLRLNGQDFNWFGNAELSLPVGTHRFTIVPPSEDCCQPAEDPAVRVVTAGEGTQTLSFRLAFRDAVLVVPSVPEGGQVSCVGFFRGAMTQPGSQRVVMNSASSTDTCVLTPPASSGSPSARKQVTLRPGQTFVLTWP